MRRHVSYLSEKIFTAKNLGGSGIFIEIANGAEFIIIFCKLRMYGCFFFKSLTNKKFQGS